MIRFRRGLLLCALLCACNSERGSADETLETSSAPAKKGSAGGFTASLTAELAGSAATGERTAGTATGEASSGPSHAGSGSAGSGSAAGSGAAGAGSGAGSAMTTTAAGSAAAVGTTTGSAATTAAGTPPAAGAGSATAVGAAAPPAGLAAKATGPAGASTTATTTTAAKPTSGAGTPPAVTTPPIKAAPPAVTQTPPAVKAPIVLSAELKAIQLSLLPNWKRDVEGAGTFSLLVDVQSVQSVQSKGETAVFKFFYGYDDPRAPSDREAYKKFLTDSKILTVVTDRQRGAAWYIEGTDASGPAFRVVVTYGGKRLVCYGSLYKRSDFGDTRDEVIIQAKKICETLQL